MADALRGHLVFSCGSGLFGLPAEWASEVVNLPPALTRVPGTPPHVLGVFPLRGELLPVIDLLVLTGAPRPPDAPPWNRAVVIRGSGTVLAFAATKVHGVASLEGSPAPEGPGGIHAHLLGPLRGTLGDVRALELDGLIDFLAAQRRDLPRAP